MQTYFSGRMLSADSLATDQAYGRVPHSLNPQAARAAAPRDIGEALVRSLPPSILDQVALNPQPLPPRETLDELPAARGETGELEMIDLQSMMAQRQMAVQMTTNMLDQLGDAMGAVIKNIK